MHTCVWVCVCVCVCVCGCECVHTCVHMCVRVEYYSWRVCACMHTCLYVPVIASTESLYEECVATAPPPALYVCECKTTTW